MISNKFFFYMYCATLSGIGGALWPGNSGTGVMVGSNVATLTSDVVFSKFF